MTWYVMEGNADWSTLLSPEPSCETGEWPERPTGAWQHCSLPTDWKRLKPDGYAGNLRFGGLGTKITLRLTKTSIRGYATIRTIVRGDWTLLLPDLALALSPALGTMQ